MRRPRGWLHWVLVGCLLLMGGEYAALTWLAPRYVLGAIERAAGGKLVIGSARLSFPFTTTLTGIHLSTNASETAVSIQRAVVKPRWLSWPSRTLWVESLELEQPLLRLTRTKAGAILRPNVPAPLSGSIGSTGTGASANLKPPPIFSSWRVQIESLRVADGIVEFVDEQPAATFHGVLQQVSGVVGPVTIPLNGAWPARVGFSTVSAAQPGLSTTPRRGPEGAARAGMSFAVRAELIGYGGNAAPLYCSGWLDPAVKDLQASCQLEPLALEAFEPYYHGPSELRVYTTTLDSTSQWSAKANELTGRIQVRLDHLSEGDLSVHGQTIINFKRLTGGQGPHLSGEIRLTGPLDHPRQWHAELQPGDPQVQELVTRLLKRDVEVIRIPLWGGRLHVGLVPASRAMMTDVEATSKEVQEALEILAAPAPEEVPEAATSVAVEGAAQGPAPATALEATPPPAMPVPTMPGGEAGSRPTPGAAAAPPPASPPAGSAPQAISPSSATTKP